MGKFYLHLHPKDKSSTVSTRVLMHLEAIGGSDFKAEDLESGRWNFFHLRCFSAIPFGCACHRDCLHGLHATPSILYSLHVISSILHRRQAASSISDILRAFFQPFCLASVLVRPFCIASMLSISFHMACMSLPLNLVS